MSQVLPSGKTGANKYDLRTNDPNKVLPRLDVRQIAQNNQRAYQQTQGYSLSGNEGAASAIDGSLSIIDDTTIGTYDDSMAKMIQTYVANASRLIVDGGSTANSLILNPPVISPGNSPNGTDYSEATSLPFAYKEGLRFTFLATLSNTGAVQVQIPGLSGLVGSVDLVDENGNNLIQGDIVVNNYYTIIAKDISGDKFILERPNFNIDNIKSQLPVGKNVIINGDFNVAQEGDSFNPPSINSYTMDQWQFNTFGTGGDGSVTRETFTLGQSDVPREPTYYFRFNQSTSSTTTGSFRNKIESVRTLAGQFATLSFWARCNISINLGLTFDQIFGGGGSPSSPVVTPLPIASIDSNWQLITATVLIPSISGKTLGSANDGSLDLVFATPKGTTFALDISRVQVEAGKVATEFEKINTTQEQENCLRYYASSGSFSTSNLKEYYQLPTSSATQIQRQTIAFPVHMRAVPSISNVRTAGTANIVAPDQITERGFRQAFGGVAPEFAEYTWIANARL